MNQQEQQGPVPSIVHLSSTHVVISQAYLEELLAYKFQSIFPPPTPAHEKPPPSDKESEDDFPDLGGSVILTGGDPLGMIPIGGFAKERANDRNTVPPERSDGSGGSGRAAGDGGAEPPGA